MLTVFGFSTTDYSLYQPGIDHFADTRPRGHSSMIDADDDLGCYMVGFHCDKSNILDMVNAEATLSSSVAPSFGKIVCKIGVIRISG